MLCISVEAPMYMPSQAEIKARPVIRKWARVREFMFALVVNEPMFRGGKSGVRRRFGQGRVAALTCRKSLTQRSHWESSGRRLLFNSSCDPFAGALAARVGFEPTVGETTD